MSGKIGSQDQSFHRVQSHNYCSLGKLGIKLESDAAAPIVTSVIKTSTYILANQKTLNKSKFRQNFGKPITFLDTGIQSNSGNHKV